PGQRAPSQSIPYGTTQPGQQQSQPQDQINTDQRRALLQASTDETPQTDGLPFEAVTGGGSGSQLSPDQIQQLMAAYGKGQLPAGLMGQSDIGKLASSATANNSAASSQEQAYMQSMQTVQQDRPRSALSLPMEQRPVRHQERALDQPRLMHRASPYADVPSLYDLYSQYSRANAPLRRFGLDIFENGTGNFDQLPMDLPAGPDYVLGPGDSVSIDLWGSVSQRLHRIVDREGRLSLPEIGSIQAAGHTLGEVQQMVQTSLRSQF